MVEKEYIERKAAVNAICSDCCEYDTENPFACEGCAERATLLAVPSADVAPRSEVAQEIFEGLERLMLDGAIGGKYPAKVINPDKYAEFRKKYVREDKG